MRRSLTSGSASPPGTTRSGRSRSTAAGRRASGRRTWTGCGSSACGATEYFGSPQDLEWAIDGAGELYLLQSRPITTLAEAEAYEDLLRTTRAELRGPAGRGARAVGAAQPGRNPAAPDAAHLERHPPVHDRRRRVRRMYRSVGFEPSEAAKRDGFLDLVAGRVYMDAARGPEMFFEGFPFRTTRSSSAAIRTPGRPADGPRRVDGRADAHRAKLAAQTSACGRSLRISTPACADRTIPAFLEWCRQRRATWPPCRRRSSSTSGMRASGGCWSEFAPDSLLPSLIAGMALADLRAFLETNFWDDDPRCTCANCSRPAPPDRTRANRMRCSTPSPAATARSPTGSPNTGTAPRGSSTWPAPGAREQPERSRRWPHG